METFIKLLLRLYKASFNITGLLMSFRFLKILTSLLIILIVSYQPLESATTAVASVNYSVSTVDAISVSGNPGTLSITSAVAGSSPAEASDSTTTYAVTTNGIFRQITGQITSGTVPTGLTLTVMMDAPAGATPASKTTMSTGAATVLVTDISQTFESGISITYILSATAQAVAGSGSWTLTYTFGP